MVKHTPTACDTLLTNCRLVGCEGRNDHSSSTAVAITGAHITDIGTDPELTSRYAAEVHIDGHGALLHPGFIDSHVHVSQYTARSVLPRMESGPVNMGHWKAEITDEDEAASLRLAAIDYFRAGYTGFVDPGTILNPSAAADVVNEIGIRVWMTDPYVADRASQLAQRLPELASEGFLSRWPRNTDEALRRIGGQLAFNSKTDGLVHGFVGLYGEETASNELYAAALKIARDAGVQFQEHRGYSPAEYLASEARLGRPNLQFLEENELLGPDITFVHMNYVREVEIAKFSTTQTKVVWCPYGQMQMLGKGGAQPKMAELWRAGCQIGIGTDIPRAINFDALGGLAIAASAAAGTPLSSTDIFEMRTLAAAKSVGAGTITGSISIGKRADLVLRADTDAQAIAADAHWESAVLGLSSPPRMVFVNGKIVFRDGIPTTADPRRVADQARGSVQSMLKRIGLI